MALSLLALTAGCGSVPRPPAALRGVPVSSFACPGRQPVAGSVSLSPRSVTALLLCRHAVPTSGRLQFATKLIVAGSPQLRPLLTALSAPDEKPSADPCAAYANAPEPIVARTAAGDFLVTIPVDGCRHFQLAAMRALDKAWAAP